MVLPVSTMGAAWLPHARVYDFHQVCSFLTGHSGIFPAYVQYLCLPGYEDAGPCHYLFYCQLCSMLVQCVWHPLQPPDDFWAFFQDIAPQALQTLQSLYRVMGHSGWVQMFQHSFSTLPPSEDAGVNGLGLPCPSASSSPSLDANHAN